MNRNLLLTGWLLFLLCLALPAVTLNSNLGFSANNQAEFGLGAGILAVLSIVSIFDSYREFQVSMLGIGNILALLCPLLLFLSNKFIHALFF